MYKYINYTILQFFNHFTTFKYHKSNKTQKNAAEFGNKSFKNFLID